MEVISKDEVSLCDSKSVDRKPITKVTNFMVFGQKKNVDPLEEFWMSKLSNIEKQYDNHIHQLEKSLLDTRIRSRTVSKQQERILQQKVELAAKAIENKKLVKKAKKLEVDFVQQKYQNSSLKNKLEKTTLLRENSMTVLRDERYERIRCEREISALKFKLGNLQRDKRLLLHDADIKESEKARIAEKIANMTKEKWTFLKKLSQTDTERRVQTTANITLCESIGQLLQVGKSQEDRLIKQKQELEDILREMEQKKKVHDNAVRKLGISERKIEDEKIATVQTKKKMDDLNHQIKHWKEELEFKDMDKSVLQSEVVKLKSDSVFWRSKAAQIQEKFEKIQSEMVSLNNQRIKTEKELSLAKQHEKSLQMLVCRNAIFREKVKERNSSSANIITSERGADKGEKKADRQEIEYYKKKIWELDRLKRDLEKRLDESRREENIIRVKLSKYSTMTEQICWTEKAMIKIEGDQKRTESLLKTLANNFPRKMPFEKIVTDPSVMDRIMKHKVLQKRLAKQSARVEELKCSASRLSVHEGRSGVKERINIEAIPQWKLSHWRNKRISQETLFELDDGTLSTQPQSLPLTERDYYKDYIQYLDESIPSIKQQIFLMEKKQTQIVAAAAEELTKRKNKEESLSDAEVSSPTRLVTVEEGAEEEEENDYETEYDEEEDTAENEEIPSTDNNLDSNY